MEKWKRRSIDLLTALIFGGRENLSVVPYYPQKTGVSQREDRFFKRTIPERKGISSRRLYNMLCELESERRANIHAIKVLAGGEVICECCAPGYEGEGWHISHSMSKTVCGMVIGSLWDEGKVGLDMRLVDIFPEITYRDKRFALITVEHLLGMTSGVEFAEPGSVTEKNWTEAFFSSGVRFTPGEKFAYNSMNTYVLSRVAERICGRPFGELAREQIFAPLGIRNYLWEIGPEGTEKAGWGLYLSTESWAKLGVMLLSRGAFDGRRILSERWVEISSAVKAVAPDKNGGFNYAYQMWVSRSGEERLFSGMFGQNVWICPKNNIVVVMTAGNNELFQKSPALEIVRKYLGGRINDRLDNRNFASLEQKQKSFFEHRRWARPLEERRGLAYFLRLRQKRPFDSEWQGIIGSYVFAPNNVGLLPLIVRAMQNSLASGIEELALVREGEELYLLARDGENCISLPVGLYGYSESLLELRGERYTVRAVGEVCDGREGREYRIELVFPELASVRRMSVRKIDGGKISVRMSETPGDRVAADYLKEYSGSNSAVAFTVDLLERRFGRGVVDKTVKNTFNPVLVGVDRAADGFDEKIREEREAALERQNKSKLIRSIVDKLFRESD